MRPGRPETAASWSLDPDAPLTRPVRWLLDVAAVLVFLAGVQLFAFPLRTDTYFAWTIKPPMTAVFLGASYWASVGLEVTAARAGRWADARIAIPAVFTFTTITLVVTLLHLDRFHLGAEFGAGTRAVTWAWIAVYATVPVLMVLAVAFQARSPGDAPLRPTGPPPREPTVNLAEPTREPTREPREPSEPAQDLGGIVRAVLVVLAVLLLGMGVGLLVVPARADGWWPWALTPLTARAVGAWLVALGVAAADARLVDDVRAVRPLAVTGVVFVVLQAVALARHGDALDWTSAQAVAFAGTLAVLGLMSGIVLRARSG